MAPSTSRPRVTNKTAPLSLYSFPPPNTPNNTKSSSSSINFSSPSRSTYLVTLLPSSLDVIDDAGSQLPFAKSPTKSTKTATNMKRKKKKKKRALIVLDSTASTISFVDTSTGVITSTDPISKIYRVDKVRPSQNSSANSTTPPPVLKLEINNITGIKSLGPEVSTSLLLHFLSPSHLQSFATAITQMIQSADSRHAVRLPPSQPTVVEVVGGELWEMEGSWRESWKVDTKIKTMTYIELSERGVDVTEYSEGNGCNSNNRGSKNGNR